MAGAIPSSKDGPEIPNPAGCDLGILARQPLLRIALALCLFGTAFYFAYRYGMAFSHATSSPFWFPDSVLLCTLLVVRPSQWWLFVLAALPIRLLLSDPTVGRLGFLLAVFAIDSAKGVLAAGVLRRFLNNPVHFETMREFALYCLFVAVLIPAAAAFAGAGARHIFLGFDYWPAWEQWFLGNVLTHVVVTPVIFYWVLGAPWKGLANSAGRWLEGGLLAAGLILTGYFAFETGAGETTFAEPRFYAPVPFLFWAAIRFGMLGATGAIAVIAFFPIDAAIRGLGTFSGRSPAETAIALQHFLLLRAVPLYLVAVVTEQKRRVEERYREVVESQTDLVCRYLPDTTLTFVNEAYCRFSGRKREDLIGKKFIDTLPEAIRGGAIDQIELVGERRGSRAWEQEVQLPDGSLGWLQWVGYPIFGPNGQLEEVQAIGHDITDRKRAELALQQSEAALRASFTRIQELVGKLITAQDVERSHIAGELHEDVNQQLAALSIALSNVKRRLDDRRDVTVRDELSRLQQRVIDLADMIRNLSQELHPGALHHAGLAATLRGYCAEVSRQHAIEVAFSVSESLNGIPQNVALCLYRVAQEILRDIATHADAHKAQVILRFNGEGLELIITEDRKVLSLTEARGLGGLGFTSLNERVRLVGGSLAINIEPQRTEVRVQVPLEGNRTAAAIA
jgi:PAS domain S-box-containing protein